MGSLFENDEEEFDLNAVEARHAEMEAEELLDAGELSEIDTGAVSDWEAIVEAVLFTMGNSVELRQLAVAIGQSEKIARRVVENLQKRYLQENRGMQIIALEDSYQMTTKAKFYENLIRVASAPKKQVLTDVVLETLSIIAYKQPVTKLEISKIRGVSSDHAVNRLIEFGLVYEAGRLDAPGRPALFATTEEFLRRFGVVSTDDLPTMNPEQAEEIKQEVEEELQLKLGTPEEQDNIGDEPEGSEEAGDASDEPERPEKAGNTSDMPEEPAGGIAESMMQEQKEDDNGETDQD